MKSIEDFIGNMTLGELKADDKTASAVIRNVRNFNYKNADGKFLSMLKNHWVINKTIGNSWQFEIIGEAAKYLPNDIKDKYTEIDWKSMTGMRDRLIHAYFGIDYKLVWSAIKIEIPKLKLKLKKMMATIEKDGQE